MQLEALLEKAGHKESKEERKIRGLREKVLARVLGEEEQEKQSFADPAAMFF